ncbi:prepilin-type N-terminal cleavage/methylation domain-containing protein [Candidatus Sumerlaeota bacterium]|nr:prepilin-type N-terminal cleavage/methylation domain-containing protein [Candidatus Sumerlaeota bacterium]
MKTKETRNCSRAFTLIELLIVVAIIAILAAIAVPNFLEAQVRSKVARATADMRSLVVALEAYAVEWNNYPASVGWTPEGELAPLTTPVAFITSVPIDPFKERHNVISSAWQARRPYDYIRYRQTARRDSRGVSYMEMPCGSVGTALGPQYFASDLGFFLFSIGPDHGEEHIYSGGAYVSLILDSYDPTNGSVSRGDMFRRGDSSQYVNP